MTHQVPARRPSQKVEGAPHAASPPAPTAPCAGPRGDRHAVRARRRVPSASRLRSSSRWQTCCPGAQTGPAERPSACFCWPTSETSPAGRGCPCREDGRATGRPGPRRPLACHRPVRERRGVWATGGGGGRRGGTPPRPSVPDALGAGPVYATRLSLTSDCAELSGRAAFRVAWQRRFRADACVFRSMYSRSLSLKVSPRKL